MDVDRIGIFADCADTRQMRELLPHVAGFTTNPSLARAAGVEHYRAFGKKAASIAGAKPVSIEVLADDFPAMAAQAREIAAWGSNVYVKVPVSNSRGRSAAELIGELAGEGIRLNVTAVFSLAQVEEAGAALAAATAPAIVSVFAGRVADTGIDPVRHVTACRRKLRETCTAPRVKMLWASSRQAYDVALAAKAGCEIITLTPPILERMRRCWGADLEEYSRSTVRDFVSDAQGANFEL